MLTKKRKKAALIWLAEKPSAIPCGSNSGSSGKRRSRRMRMRRRRRRKKRDRHHFSKGAFHL